MPVGLLVGSIVLIFSRMTLPQSEYAEYLLLNQLFGVKLRYHVCSRFKCQDLKLIVWREAPTHSVNKRGATTGGVDKPQLYNDIVRVHTYTIQTSTHMYSYDE